MTDRAAESLQDAKMSGRSAEDALESLRRLNESVDWDYESMPDIGSSSSSPERTRMLADD